MQQEVIQIAKNEELELLPPKQRYECVDCHKNYTHIEHCKDGKNRCKKCKKKVPTNKFYNPNWKDNRYIGNFSVNKIEYRLLVEKYVKQGCSHTSAKTRVEYDLNNMKNNKQRKFMEERESKREFNDNINSKKELNKKFLEGIGQERKCLQD